MSKISTNLGSKGVSPVVATIVLIAIAVVASASLGGFVTGLFGSFTATQSVNNAFSEFATALLT